MQPSVALEPTAPTRVTLIPTYEDEPIDQATVAVVEPVVKPPRTPSGLEIAVTALDGAAVAEAEALTLPEGQPRDENGRYARCKEVRAYRAALLAHAEALRAIAAKANIPAPTPGQRETARLVAAGVLFPASEPVDPAITGWAVDANLIAWDAALLMECGYGNPALIETIAIAHAAKP